MLSNLLGGYIYHESIAVIDELYKEFVRQAKKKTRKDRSYQNAQKLGLGAIALSLMGGAYVFFKSKFRNM